MVTVRKGDLDIVVAACSSYLPSEVSPEVLDAFARVLRTSDEAHGIEGEVRPAEPEADPRPEGIYGRVELPGRRNHTGWIAGASVWGTEGLVVRDWDGRIIADVVMGPGCEVVRLPTPLKRPESRLALTAGPAWSDPDDDPDDRSWGDGPF